MLQRGGSLVYSWPTIKTSCPPPAGLCWLWLCVVLPERWPAMACLTSGDPPSWLAGCLQGRRVPGCRGIGPRSWRWGQASPPVAGPCELAGPWGLAALAGGGEEGWLQLLAWGKRPAPWALGKQLRGCHAGPDCREDSPHHPPPRPFDPSAFHPGRGGEFCGTAVTTLERWRAPR